MQAFHFAWKHAFPLAFLVSLFCTYANLKQFSIFFLLHAFAFRNFSQRIWHIVILKGKKQKKKTKTRVVYFLFILFWAVIEFIHC